MARPPRVEVPGALYHVTARGNERRALFRGDADREQYLDRIARCRREFRFQLLAYCLMTNHVHLAIRTGPQPLSRIVGRLHSTYAAWFNRRHDRVGHLFQGRYKAFLVRDDRHLHALVRYIHRNPVQAGIARRAADYPWSSDRFLRRGRGPDWLDVDPLLSLLDEARRSAARRYVELVDGPAPDTEDPASEIVPADADGAGLLLLAPPPASASAAPDPVVSGMPLDDLLEAVARDGGLTLADLQGRKRGGEVAAARCRAAYLARQLFRIPVRRVALRPRRLILRATPGEAPKPAPVRSGAPGQDPAPRSPPPHRRRRNPQIRSQDWPQLAVDSLIPTATRLAIIRAPSDAATAAPKTGSSSPGGLAGHSRFRED